jgi:hypothetical protein
VIPTHSTNSPHLPWHMWTICRPVTLQSTSCIQLIYHKSALCTTRHLVWRIFRATDPPLDVAFEHSSLIVAIFVASTFVWHHFKLPVVSRVSVISLPHALVCLFFFSHAGLIAVLRRLRTSHGGPVQNCNCQGDIKRTIRSSRLGSWCPGHVDQPLGQATCSTKS